jgi:co-chaperonin GroES (HSP10)
MAIAFETDDVPVHLIPQPAGWRLAVAPVKIKDVSKGGIALVNETIEHSEYFRTVGKVVAIGDQCYRHPKFNAGVAVEVREPEPWVKVGDIVHYSNYGGMDINFIYNDKPVKIKVINDDEVLTKISDTSILGLE